MMKGISDVVYEAPRLDFENYTPLGRKTETDLLEALEQAAGEVDVLCVSDQMEFGCITPGIRHYLCDLGKRHLHGVRAWSELLDILRERERNRTLPRVLLHAWNGPHELAREFLRLGALFSVGLRELSHSAAAERYARIPEGRLFPETDDHPENWSRTVALLGLLRNGLTT